MTNEELIKRIETHKRYWRKREDWERERQSITDSYIEQMEQELQKMYLKTAKATAEDIERLYLKMIADSADGTVMASDLYRAGHLYEVLNEMKQRLQEMGFAEQEIFQRDLSALYEQTGIMTAAELDIDRTINEDALKRAVNSTWCSDGKEWSERIWQNNAALADAVESSLFSIVQKGERYTKVAKAVQEQFGVSFSEAKRLVRTELSYVENKGALDKFREAGIDYYEIDVHRIGACELCEEVARNGPYKVDEVVLPTHPNCRCGVLAILN